MVCSQKLPFQSMAWGRCILKLGRRVSRGKGREETKVLIFLETWNFLIVDVS